MGSGSPLLNPLLAVHPPSLEALDTIVENVEDGSVSPSDLVSVMVTTMLSESSGLGVGSADGNSIDSTEDPIAGSSVVSGSHMVKSPLGNPNVEDVDSTVEDSESGFTVTVTVT